MGTLHQEQAMNDEQKIQHAHNMADAAASGWRDGVRYAVESGAVVVPDGYVLVPVEPTHEMAMAAKRELEKSPVYSCRYKAALRAAIAAAPAQGQQVDDQDAFRSKTIAKLMEMVNDRDRQIAALKAQKSEDSDTVRRICDLLGIGSKARTQAAIMANVENVHKFARMLDAIEAEFFMVPGEIDPDYPDDQPYDCLVNRWASTPEQYVEQFRAALGALKAQQVGQEPVAFTSEMKLRQMNDIGVGSMWPARIADDSDVALYTAPQPAPAQDVAGLVEALKAADEYLSDNPFNEIGSGSILHRQIKDALAAHDKQSGGEV